METERKESEYSDPVRELGGAAVGADDTPSDFIGKVLWLPCSTFEILARGSCLASPFIRKSWLTTP